MSFVFEDWTYFTVPKLLKVLGSVFAIALTHSVADAQTPSTTASIETGDRTDQARHLMLTGDMKEFWSVVAERAPEHFEKLESQFQNALEASQTLAEKEAQLRAVEIDYYASLSELVVQIPPKEIQEIIASDFQALQELRESPPHCSLYADGLLTPSAAVPLARRAVTSAAVTRIDHLLAARDLSVEHKLATTQDFTELTVFMVEGGLSMDAVWQAMLGRTGAGWVYCKSIREFMRLLIEYEGLGKERLERTIAKARLTQPKANRAWRLAAAKKSAEKSAASAKSDSFMLICQISKEVDITTDTQSEVSIRENWFVNRENGKITSVTAPGICNPQDTYVELISENFIGYSCRDVDDGKSIKRVASIDIQSGEYVKTETFADGGETAFIGSCPVDRFF